MALSAALKPLQHSDARTPSGDVASAVGSDACAELGCTCIQPIRLVRGIRERSFSFLRCMAAVINHHAGTARPCLLIAVSTQPKLVCVSDDAANPPSPPPPLPVARPPSAKLLRCYQHWCLSSAASPLIGRLTLSPLPCSLSALCTGNVYKEIIYASRSAPT